jgi:predicted ATP-dependent protease
MSDSLLASRDLPAERLRTSCDPASFDFETTADLPELREPLGQPRAASALDFAIRMPHEGYNVFALGPEGVGKRTLVERLLAEASEQRPAAPDWCYVHNFERPDRPRALRLAAGKGLEFQRDMRRLVEDVQAALKAAFESEEYVNGREVIDEEFNDKPRAALQQLNEHAEKKGFGVLKTPVGVVFAPLRGGEVLPKEEYLKLSEDERKRIETETKELEAEFKTLTEKLPDWERERRQRIRQLNTEITDAAVSRLLEALRAKYIEHKPVSLYLEAVQQDVLDHAMDFIAPEEQNAPVSASVPLPEALAGSSALRRYEVNVLVEGGSTSAAPVVYEDNPTFQNLVGRIEHLAQFGNLVTDFRLIRAGALHRANGGFLVIDARKLVVQPFAWEGLKRALSRREIQVESLGRALSITSTISLEPEPIPLNVRVVLLGDRRLYYLLAQHDPEFETLFKVQADFADDVERSDEHYQLFARWMGTMARSEKMRALDTSAVARIIDEQARRVGDAERLSAHSAYLQDLVREADFFAEQAHATVIAARHVEEAIESREFRADRVKQRIFDEIERGTLRIATKGEQVGQVNGLSVVQMGEFLFGRPTRISARVAPGRGGVVDIEREVELGGPLHSKGVMILAGFLAGRCAIDRPLALSATLVFEQSYGGVEGDSASSAELLALLSALADVPLRQSLAITGSVSQSGDVQAIGGVNEKIEGFYELCERRGLTGEQGVVIPQSNVPHLMLRKEVVRAVAEGRFHVYQVSTIDEAVELMTGVSAGERDAEGRWPDESVFGRIDARLRGLAEALAELGKDGEEKTA